MFASPLASSRNSFKMDVKFSLPILLLTFVYYIPNSEAQRREFDVCKVGPTKDQNHVCLKIHDCPSSLAGIKKGIIPKICGYVKNVPIVCCAPNSTTKLPPPSAASIVSAMCNKYKEPQYRVDVYEGNLPGDPPRTVRTPDCPLQETLIVGGKPAKPKEFPHMALLGYGESVEDREWKCGGSLISERFILTAAHCIVREQTAKRVRLGELNYDVETDETHTEDFNITQAFVHPNYTSTSVYNDIALLKLDRDVKFSPYIRPVCLDVLPRVSETRSIATGWGTIGVGLPVSEELMKVTLPFLPIDECKKFFGQTEKYRFGIQEATQLCAGDNKGGKDTCVGDSGGPLQIYTGLEPCMFTQLGITSFGSEFCGAEKSPGVYIKVSSYLDWIQGIVWPYK